MYQAVCILIEVNLSHLCKHYHISLAQVAEYCQIDMEKLTSLASGKDTLTDKELASIAQLFGVSIDALVVPMGWRDVG